MATVEEQLPVDETTRIRRESHRQVTDRSVLHAILDEALVAHVGVVRDGLPLVLPFACARDEDSLLLHGSSGAGLLRLGAGTPVSVSVTHLDGLVVARNAFDSSMRYRSAVVHGIATPLVGAERVRALEVLTDHLLPGRTTEVRPSTAKELAATLVLRVSLATASVKVAAGPPVVDPDDVETRSVWAGILPLRLTAGAPVPSPDVPPGVDVPASVLRAQRRHEDQAVGAEVREVHFGHLRIVYDGDELEPRQWTTLQSAWAAELLRTLPPGPVLELCSGVGHIGLLAVADTDRRLVLVDSEEKASHFARLNAADAGRSGEVEVRHGDMTEVVHGGERFALVLADPPWVASADVADEPGDPQDAIDGGSDGLQLVRTCLEVIGRTLADRGAALLQVGGRDQVAATEQHLAEHPELRLTVVAHRSGEGGAVVELRR